MLNSPCPRPSLRAKRSNPVERPSRLDCFTLRVRNDVEPLPKQNPPKKACRVAWLSLMATAC
ncbi:MAG: hypothetical protein LBT00_08250 [Spirochaetaceae bacterium]|nr:hypothetical protein [Spirochaetaceae bacterium]